MKKFFAISAVVLAGLTLVPADAFADRPTTVWVVRNGRHVRQRVSYDGDRPYYNRGRRREFVREYYNSEPRYRTRQGRREYYGDVVRPRIEVNF